MDYRTLTLSLGLASLTVTAAAQGTARQPVGAQATAGDKSAVMLSAQLVEADANSRRGDAVVRVQVSGFELAEPKSGQRAERGKGHLHYRIDNAPTVSTAASELRLHGLARGMHNLEITPVDSEHRPIGGPVQVSIQIP